MTTSASPFVQSYYHGTRAQLQIGDLISTGHRSNFALRAPLSWVYFTSTLDAAIWAAELADRDDAQRIYIVEPTGEIMDDPNVTDRKYPGNPTLSYRSRHPLRIIATVENWVGHLPHEVELMRSKLAALREVGDDTILD